MPIDRGPWNALIDDDGSNLVGSIWNKAAIKTVLLDPTDAAIVPGTPTYGTWTPADASGAGLVFTTVEATYLKTDRRVEVWVKLNYPSTASGASCLIGGLPFANGTKYAGFHMTHSAGIQLGFHLIPNATSFYLMNPVAGTIRPNSELSGKQIIFQGAYLTSYL